MRTSAKVRFSAALVAVDDTFALGLERGGGGGYHQARGPVVVASLRLHLELIGLHGC